MPLFPLLKPIGMVVMAAPDMVAQDVGIMARDQVGIMVAITETAVQ